MSCRTTYLKQRKIKLIITINVQIQKSVTYANFTYLITLGCAFKRWEFYTGRFSRWMLARTTKILILRRLEELRDIK